MLTLAVSQYAPVDSSSGNLERIEHLARNARDDGASVLVLPEYSAAFVPVDPVAMAAVAEPIDGGFTEGLANISRQLDGLVLISGMVLKREHTYSAIVAVGSDGVLAVAEKLHLYDAFGGQESSWLTPGRVDKPPLLQVGEHMLGFMTCYDLRFSEVAAWLVDAGATTLIVPAQWVPGPRKEDHWDTLLRARAIESQCFVVGAGQPAPHGVGRSQVISPVGDVLLQMDSREGQRTVSLDVADVVSAREANPMARSRRFLVQPKP